VKLNGETGGVNVQSHSSDVTALTYQIRVRGHLSDNWGYWFTGLTLENRSNGDAVLTGPVSDQAALHAILNHIRDLGLTLVALRCVELADPSISSG
jgi:hypothetical protein